MALHTTRRLVSLEEGYWAKRVAVGQAIQQILRDVASEVDCVETDTSDCWTELWEKTLQVEHYAGLIERCQGEGASCQSGRTWDACAEGHTGPLCAVCESEYQMDSASFECTECEVIGKSIAKSFGLLASGAPAFMNAT